MDLDYLFRQEDLVQNPTARVPVCLCLDVSGSMRGAPLNELNRGIREFYQAIQNDEVALYAAEICIITFGGNGEAKCLSDFARLQNKDDSMIEPPELIADGITPLGEGVNLALDKLDKRKNEYKAKGVDYYQPWLVIMTDGEPNGDSRELERALNRVQMLLEEKKLTVFPIGIGSDANLSILSRFSKNGEALKLQGLKFSEFFEWLSQSVSKTSQSTPGEKVEIDMSNVKSWSEL